MLGSTGDNPLSSPWSAHVSYNTGLALLLQLPDIVLGDINKAAGHTHQHYRLLSLLATVGSTNNPMEYGKFYPFPTDTYSDNLIPELPNTAHSCSHHSSAIACLTFPELPNSIVPISIYKFYIISLI
jgi:hypothetical protein